MTGNHSDYMAPRDSLELKLARIWEDLLDERPIGVDQNFFDIGGDSVLAMSLMARVVHETGHTLPMAGLVESPTIEKLAQALREEADPAKWSPLVPIQAEGAKRPFYCVHPAGGNVLCYLQLARKLGNDQPFYGLQAPGIDGIREPLGSAEEMAGEYLEAIRKLQPQGPYALGGWSFGGIVAYEMAQRLLAAGEEVAFLAIFDSGVLYAFAVMRSLLVDANLLLWDGLRLPLDEQIQRFRKSTAPARLIPEEADQKLAAQIFHVCKANLRAMFNYGPESYPGKLTLFQGDQRVVKTRHTPEREWSKFCDRIEVHAVPGNHLTLIHEPNVGPLAEKLAACLDAA